MSLDGKNKIPVKILRVTGATESLMVESILPFSTHAAPGKKIPVFDIGLVPLWVPLHHFHLFSDPAWRGGNGCPSSFADSRHRHYSRE